MLFSPTNLYPSILSGSYAIDATKDNEFSVQINGNTQVTKYRLKIYQNNTQSTLVYDAGEVTLSSPLYPVDYNGVAQRISILVPSTSGMINGTEYKYTVEIFDTTMSVVTSEEPFKAIKTSILNLSVPPIITTKEYEFIGEYIQENGVQVKHFTWTLKNLTANTVIKKTNEIYSQDIRFYYDGFLGDNKYSINLIV